MQAFAPVIRNIVLIVNNLYDLALIIRTQAVPPNPIQGHRFHQHTLCGKDQQRH